MTEASGDARSATPRTLVALGALGIVYGDIGTSPLYALREAAKAAANGSVVTPAAALAATSAIVWSLIIVVL